MAGAKSKDLSDGNLLIKFTETLQEKPQKVSLDDITIWSKSREVEFAEAQEMLAAVELYQAGKPMQIIGRKIFEGSPEREKLTVTLVRKYRDIDRTLTNYSVKIQLGGEVSRLCEFSVQTNRYFSGTSYGWHQGHSMPALQAQQKDEHYIRNELIFQYCAKGEIEETRDQARFWIPGSNVTPVMSHHCIVLRLMPLAGLKHVSVEPVGGYQGLDGRIMPKTDFTLEQADKIATDYKNMLVRYISPRRFENDFKATLPNGVTVELIGVCEHPSKNKKWWRPDGKILSADQTPSEYSRMTVKPDENEQARELSMHFSGPGVESMSFRWKIDKSTRSSSHPFYLSKQREKLKPIRNIVFKVPRNTKTADLSVGVAVGDWKKAAYGGDGRTVSGTNDSLTGSSVIFHEAINENDMVKLSATHLLGDNYDCRIVVVDRDDKLHEPVKSSNSGDDMRLCTGFFSLQKEQIRQVMLESRPFHVAHFKNVSVKPGFRTDSKVRVTGESPENTVPQEMVGTWFFDNPGGDNEQMAVFPDSRVVVLYSNGHRDETRYLDGFIQLAEYDNARYKISVDKGGTLIQSFDSGGSLLISKRWERIDPQPRTSLLRQLTGPDKGQAVTRIEAGDAITYDWVIEHYGQTRRLSDKEKLEVDNWVSLHASVVKNSGRYLIPDNGLTLKDLIKAAGYNKSTLAESYVELIRRTRQGNLTARSVYSRNLKTLLNSR
jgi:hypothetical protein